MEGHKKENCYKLTGFSPDFKFNKHKKQESYANQVNNGTSEGTKSSLSASSLPTFTAEQYNRILQYLDSMLIMQFSF